MSIALLDLGSNTFNLLIAAPDGQGHFKKLYGAKLPARLGENSYESNKITPAAFQRGMEALKMHLKKIEEFGCERVFAFGTAALRSASNGQQFAETVLHELNLRVTIIDGDTEAQLIFHGVQMAMDLKEPSLIMDIGGGSTEFIAVADNAVLWKKSFPLGAAKLHQWLKPTDPITENEQQKLWRFLRNELSELPNICRAHQVQTLIGSSGSFDSLADLVEWELHQRSANNISVAREIDTADFEQIKNRILLADREARLKLRGLPAFRVDLIVLAVIAIDVVLKNCQLSKIKTTDYALKEGVLNQVLNGKL